ncbi:hypothetical protein [Motiliproteus sp.]|uniref:hypothetical protein n=1 Tax=Motiliproteus sp. TaxID=1898955 RepID=UPI003BAA2180
MPKELKQWRLITVGIVKRKVADIIKEYDLPQETQLLGYVVHIEESDEFLAVHENTSEMERWGWSHTPENAKLYRRSDKAIKVAQRCKSEAMVCSLFDTGPQLMVFPLWPED